MSRGELTRKQRNALRRLLMCRREGIAPAGVHDNTWRSLVDAELVTRDDDGAWLLTDAGDIRAHQLMHELYAEAVRHLPVAEREERDRLMIEAALRTAGYDPTPAVGQVWVDREHGDRVQITSIGNTINGWQASVTRTGTTDGKPFTGRGHIYLRTLATTCHLDKTEPR